MYFKYRWITCFNNVVPLGLYEMAPNEFLGPFLEVIRSEDTTGPITGLALTSINKFLAYGLIGKMISIVCILYYILKIVMTILKNIAMNWRIKSTIEYKLSRCDHDWFANIVLLWILFIWVERLAKISTLPLRNYVTILNEAL